MKIDKIQEMKGGWFVGNFLPTCYCTEHVEVGYKLHPKGEKWPVHYHKIATEVNLLVKGEMILQGKQLKTGDIFILLPYEIADPEFLTDCEIVCVKLPGADNDKYVV